MTMTMGLRDSLLWIICFLLRFSYQFDNVSVLNGSHSLSPSNNRTIVSSGGVFELGFFNPDPSLGDRWYVGIWYKNLPETFRSYVWVANRDIPLKHYNGTLEISGAILIIRDPSDNHIVWSSTSSGSVSPVNVVAELLANGNFVLRKSNDEDPGNFLWQSFDNPTDTLLPGMKLGIDCDLNSRTANINRFLTSWKSYNDPSSGNYSLKLESQDGSHGLSITGSSENGRVFWSGPWNGAVFMRLPRVFTATSINQGATTCFLYMVKNMSMLKLAHTALLFQLSWNQSTEMWDFGWYSAGDPCDYYNLCGYNAYCDIKAVPSRRCTCIQGYERIGPDMTSGCVKKHPFTCGSDKFLTLVNMSFPSFKPIRDDSIHENKECEEKCVRDCNCTAFSVTNTLQFSSFSCVIWRDKIVDLRRFNKEIGITIHVKLDGKMKKKKKKNNTGLTIGLCLGIPGLIFFGVAIYCCWKRKQTEVSVVRESSTNPTELIENAPLPPMEFEAIRQATDNFSHKIGEGGFGQVYSGRLPDGREIAAKKLSDSSNQGKLEFKTEVMVVGNLQHLNLVSLIGWSVHGDEMVLVYELLRNGNLEDRLFGQSSGELTWEMKYEIIKGVARGLAYLHEGSRFVTVHRDLKPANILLDQDMLPKISDFGMARIVQRDQNQAHTTRGAGTYGYMPPEYMSMGDYSPKMDVFAFGVIVVEVVTGQKNRRFFHEPTNTNLLPFVFNCYNDENWGDILDHDLNPVQFEQVKRALRIGLTCVQMNAETRPTMSSVSSLLDNETLPVSVPRHPGFYFDNTRPYTSRHEGESSASVNYRTISEIVAR